MDSTLTVLSVIDCYKCKWHEINLKKIKSGNDLFQYFQYYHKNKNIIIDIDIEGVRYNLKRISSLYKYCSKDPNRMCLYIYLY